MVIKNLVTFAAVASLLGFISKGNADSGRESPLRDGEYAAARDSGDVPHGGGPLPESSDDSANCPEENSAFENHGPKSNELQIEAFGRRDDQIVHDFNQIQADYQQIQNACARGKYDQAQRDLDRLIQHRLKYDADSAKARTDPSGAAATTTAVTKRAEAAGE